MAKDNKVQDPKVIEGAPVENKKGRKARPLARFANKAPDTLPEYVEQIDHTITLSKAIYVDANGRKVSKDTEGATLKDAAKTATAKSIPLPKILKNSGAGLNAWFKLMKDLDPNFDATAFATQAVRNEAAKFAESGVKMNKLSTEDVQFTIPRATGTRQADPVKTAVGNLGELISSGKSLAEIQAAFAEEMSRLGLK